MEAEVLARLDRIEQALTTLANQAVRKDWYSVEEFAAIVNRSPFSCREWCRLERINGEKKKSGRGQHMGWRISHEELLRYQRDGLLPIRKRE